MTNQESGFHATSDEVFELGKMSVRSLSAVCSWAARSVLSGPMMSAAPASSSSCAGTSTLAGSLRVSLARIRRRRPAIPPAALTRSTAMISARSELTLLAARNPE